MKRGWLVIALLVSLGINLGLVGVGLARRAAAERWERVRHGLEAPPERFAHRLADRIGVPAERRERFLAVQRRMIERTAAERLEVARLRLALRRELLSRASDRGRIDALLEELGAREAALNRAFVDSVLESRDLLDERELELYLRFLERAAPGRRPGARERPPRRSPP